MRTLRFMLALVLGLLLVAGPAAAQDAPPEAASDLRLTSICTDEDRDVHYMRVRNNTDRDIDYSVTLGGSGDFTAPANSDTFFDATVGETVRITFGSSDQFQQVKAQNTNPCDRIPEPGPPDEPDAPDDFSCNLPLALYHLGQSQTASASRAHINVDVACVHAYMTGNTVTETDSSDDFTDIPDSGPERVAIAYLAERGITKGFPDGTVKPNQNVRRDQTTAFVMRAIRHADDNGASTLPYAGSLGSDIYNDVCPCNVHDMNIGHSTEQNILQGFPNGEFRPFNNISNQQIHRLMLRWLDEQVPKP